MCRAVSCCAMLCHAVCVCAAQVLDADVLQLPLMDTVQHMLDMQVRPCWTCRCHPMHMRAVVSETNIDSLGPCGHLMCGSLVVSSPATACTDSHRQQACQHNLTSRLEHPLQVPALHHDCTAGRGTLFALVSVVGAAAGQSHRCSGAGVGCALRLQVRGT